MWQTRSQSLIETLVNVLIGYVIALASQLAVFPGYGIRIPFSVNLKICVWFTIISIIRSYALRRLFNGWSVRLGMAGQTRTHSFTESLINTLIGYIVAVASQLFVFPRYGIHISWSANLEIGLIFTAISIARSYFLRRAFNWWALSNPKFVDGYSNSLESGCLNLKVAAIK